MESKNFLGNFFFWGIFGFGKFSGVLKVPGPPEGGPKNGFLSTYLTTSSDNLQR